MKFSVVFLVLFLVAAGCGIGWALEDHASGYGPMALIAAALFVLVALYNRLHNGTWFSDYSGGK